MPRPARRSRSTPRTGYAKSGERQARILAAARAEASDAGLHETSLAAIAERAGVALGGARHARRRAG